jgi:hypothetical protein
MVQGWPELSAFFLPASAARHCHHAPSFWMAMQQFMALKPQRRFT